MTREEARKLRDDNIKFQREAVLDSEEYFEAEEVLEVIDEIIKAVRKCDKAIEALQERPKGRWIELPCEVGSTVWCIYENKVHKAVACKVSVAKGLYNFNLTRIEAEFDIIDSFYNDGRTQKMAIYAIYLETVFLTKEEAEKALADMKGE